MNQNCALGS